LTEQEALLQPFDGKRNNFELHIWPGSQKNGYYDNEELFINLRANEDCYFVVYQVDIDNNMHLPQLLGDRQKCPQGGGYPDHPGRHQFCASPPYGEERIFVYASQRPFTIPEDQYSPQSISRERLASPRRSGGLRAVPATVPKPCR
jgi:hypothetical protein